jgi:hypothetical protein
MRRACIAGGLALCLAGCHREPQEAHHSAITVDTVPATEVPTTAPDGTIILGSAGAATRLSNGNLVIADVTDGALVLRIFDSAGTHLKDFGRRGHGPGELMSIGALCRSAGDSLVVLDMDQRRVLVFSPDGTLGRAMTVEPLFKLFCSPSGMTLAIGPISDFFRPTLQNAGRMEHVPVYLMTHADTIHLYDSLPAVDPRFGGRVPAFAIAGSRAMIGLADSAFATVFDSSGRELEPIRVSDDPKPQTRAGFEHVIDAYFGKHPGLASLKPEFLKLPHPDRAPAYFALYGTPDGTLWTQLSELDDSIVHLRATDSLGTTIGDVTLPFPLTIFEIGNDYILGRRENEMGEQRVVVYRTGRREDGKTGSP